MAVAVTDMERRSDGLPEPSVWSISGSHAATLDGIVAGLALLRSVIAPEDAELGPIDIVADGFDDTAEVAQAVRTLVRLLVQELATGQLDPGAADERDAALGTIDAEVEAAGLRVNRARRNAALDDAAEIVREIGFEYHDLDCILASTKDAGDSILAIPVTPPAAHVYLLGRLFERADQLMASDHTLSMERSASAWYFARWSSGSIETDEATTAFPRAIREQEWSLVSRETVALAAPMIASFVGGDESIDDDVIDDEPIDDELIEDELIDDDEVAIELPPRQAHLARALLESTVGIVEIVEVDGPVMTVRDLNTTATYRVYEHNAEMAPVVGLLLLGRILPLDDDLWLRSPGAIVLAPNEGTDRDTLASLLEQVAGGLPTPIALEGLISTVVYGAEVPVAIRPAPTIAEAKAALAEVGDVLADIGLLDEALDAEPDEVAAVDLAVLDAVGLGLDETMAEWIAALLEQAALDTPRTEGGGSKGKKRKRANRSRQHRRRR